MNANVAVEPLSTIWPLKNPSVSSEHPGMPTRSSGTDVCPAPNITTAAAVDAGNPVAWNDSSSPSHGSVADSAPAQDVPYGDWLATALDE